MRSSSRPFVSLKVTKKRSACRDLGGAGRGTGASPDIGVDAGSRSAILPIQAGWSLVYFDHSIYGGPDYWTCFEVIDRGLSGKDAMRPVAIVEMLETVEVD